MAKQKIITKWDLTPLFKGDNDPEIARDLERAKQESYVFINKWQKRSDYLSEPKVLAQALDEYDAWLTKTGCDGKAGYYIHLRLAQDETNPKLKALEAKIRNLSREISNGLEFFFNRLSKVSAQTQEKFIHSPELKKYQYLLEELFKNAKYILPEGEEKILTLKSTPAYGSWVDLVSNFLSKEVKKTQTEQGKNKEHTIEELMTLTTSQKKAVRDAAGEALNEVLAKHAELAEHELNAILDNKKTSDELRGFTRPDAPRHLSDAVDSEVVDAMLAAVEKRFDLARRFYALKAKSLGIKKFKYYERSLGIGKIDKNYSYDDAVQLVQKTFGNLDSEFLAIFNRFSSHGQIDVFPQKGRSGGAFCTHDLITFPTYILLNHTNKLRDVLTLAHELGHGINNELVRAAQPAVYFGTPTSTAEVASTFMEDFVFQTLEQDIDNQTRFALIMAKLQDDVSSIFRQVACYRFEQELHQTFRAEGYLAKDKIGQMFTKHMKAYLGPTFSYNQGEENWWVYWSHIRNFFYVYSYASGLLISKSLQAMVREDNKNINKVKQFLSAGTSDSPKNIFQKIGINIADKHFWDKGLAEIEHLLTEAEKLQRLIDKKGKKS